MRFDWPVFTLIVALLALWIARTNYRRSNFVIVRVLDFAFSTSFDRRGKKSQLKVVVQNVGIPVHNLQMVLGFHGPGYSGWCNIPMVAGEDEASTREGQFAKGAITSFSLTVENLDLAARCFFSAFDETGIKTAKLTLFADKYRVWDYRLARFGRRAMRLWNWLGYKVNYKVKKRVGPGASGQGVYRFRVFLPPFMDPAQNLWEFSRHVPKPDPPPTPPRALRNGPVASEAGPSSQP
jgi:hypothetical protein